MNPTSPWHGRVDAAEGNLALRWHQVVRPFAADASSGVAFIGLASDEGVRRNQGRPGAAEGPLALRRQLSNLPAWSGLSLWEAGTVEVTDHHLEAAQREYADRVSTLLSHGLLPIGLGGGHEIAFGTFSGLANHLARTSGSSVPPRIGILSLDAHFDLRAADVPTSGTPFRQVSALCLERGWPFHYAVLGISEFSNTEALFQTARDLGVTWVLDEDLTTEGLPAARQFVTDFLQQVDALYLTVCLDVLPAAVAPGVSAPSARGVSVHVLESLIDTACDSGKLRATDVAELNPSLDEDARTARVAARIVGRITSKGARRG